MIKKYIFYTVIYVLTSIVVFFLIAYPSLQGDIDIQAYSDALTYERLASVGVVDKVSVSFNLIAPIYIVKIFNNNYILIYIFNLVLFVLSIIILFKYYSLKYNIFLFFIFINSMTLFMLFSVNKEILLFFDIILFLIYLKNRSLILLFIVILFGYTIRWQFSLFIVITIISLYIERFYKKRFLILLLLLASISIVFPLLSGMFGQVLSIVNQATDQHPGTGIFPMLIKIQTKIGGYFIIFLPKLLQLLFGLIARSYLLLDWSDFWNNFIQTLSSISFFVLIFWGLYKRRFNLKNITFYVAAIFSIIFALTPIFSVRYFYPLYVLLSVIVSQKQKRVK